MRSSDCGRVFVQLLVVQLVTVLTFSETQGPLALRDTQGPMAPEILISLDVWTVTQTNSVSASTEKGGVGEGKGVCHDLKGRGGG